MGYLLLSVLVVSLIGIVLIPTAFAVEYAQVVSTSDETLDIGIYTIPEIPNTAEPTVIKIHFLKSSTVYKQRHIDYSLSVSKDGDYLYGPTRLILTHTGTTSFQVEFTENGLHKMDVGIEGILFRSIPLETASFTINVGQVSVPSAETTIPAWIKNNAGWWAESQINYTDFVKGIEYMIKEKIMIIPDLPEQDTQKMELKDQKHAMGLERDENLVPNWVKNTASWWADGLISDDDFVSGIKYLVEQGIIKV